MDNIDFTQKKRYGLPPSHTAFKKQIFPFPMEINIVKPNKDCYTHIVESL